MEIIIRNGWESFTLNFDSKVPVNKGKLKSLGELVTLKDIEKEVRDYLNLTHWRTLVMPGVSQTRVNASEEDFIRIKTIVRRDNIIENILRDDK
jgi:sulfite reductase beta subunit-like hemoprotein